MGKLWGSLAHVRNVVYVQLSPYELNPFANFWKKSLNGAKRDIVNNAPYFIPPTIFTYLLLDWADKENQRVSRKQPGQFDLEA